MTKVYLSLGSNLGARISIISETLERLLSLPESKVIGLSEFYETPAWGKEDQPDFINLCCELETALSAQDLLTYCQQIEQDLGRERKEKWGPRTIDIDILFFGQEVVNEENLVVPHPYIQERAFVLQPLSDIAPDFVHPVLNQSIKDLLAKVDISDLVQLVIE